MGLKAAAVRLGLSEKTVRKRAKTGGVPSRLVTTPFGDRYEVLVDSPTSAPPTTPPATTPRPSTPDIAGLVALAEQLRADLMASLMASQAALVARTEAAAVWQARAEFLAGQVQQLQAALEAPKVEPVATEPAPVAEAAPGPAARPWWRFW